MKFEELKDILEQTYENKIDFEFGKECVYSISLCFQEGHPLPKGVVTYNRVAVTPAGEEKRYFPLDPIEQKEASFLDIYNLMLNEPAVHYQDLKAIDALNQQIESVREMLKEEDGNQDQNEDTIEMLQKSKDDLFEKLQQFTGLSVPQLMNQYYNYKENQQHGDDPV